MSGLTINELYKLCEKQIRYGNGEKHILISDDDEGNGYHYLFYSFTNIKDVADFKDVFWDNISNDDYIILG